MAFQTIGGSNLPVVGETLGFDHQSRRTYSFIAYGTTTTSLKPKAGFNDFLASIFQPLLHAIRNIFNLMIGK